LVPVPTQSPHPDVQFVSLWGYTLGGYVVLEYDVSPVGPYMEFVTMSSLVYAPLSLFRMGIGQWGSRLYVSNSKAEQLCKETWGVPAEYANIQLLEKGDGPFIDRYPSHISSNMEQGPDIQVQGWKKTRIHDSTTNRKRMGPLHITWTPTIKALWASIGHMTWSTHESKDSKSEHHLNRLPIHGLRLSAGSIQIRLDWQRHPGTQVIPLGIQLVVDDAWIEISPQRGYV
jgi:hypothetical protein